MIHVLGHDAVATCFGIAGCDLRDGDQLPFVAFAPLVRVGHEAMRIAREEGGIQAGDSVRDTLDLMSKHGTVIFFDNLEAATSFMGRMVFVMQQAGDTEWAERQSEDIPLAS